MQKGIALFNLISPEEHYYKGTLEELTEKLQGLEWPHLVVVLDGDIASIYKGSKKGLKKKYEFEDGKWTPSTPSNIVNGYIKLARMHLEM